MDIDFIDQQIRTLTNQHATLEAQLQTLMSQPNWNEFEAEDIKKSKLRIKDKLAALHRQRYELMNELDWD